MRFAASLVGYNRGMEETEPQKPTIRAVFVDIDGTLVGSDNRVSARVQNAVAAARDRGCEIVLCTGRSRFTAEFIAVQLPPPGYIVTSNGGVVMHLGSGELLSRRLLSIPTALEVARHIVAFGAEPYVYEDSVLPGVEGARVLHHPELPVGSFAIPPRYRPHPTLLEDLPFDPISVSAFGPPEKIRPLVQKLRDTLSSAVSVIESGSEDYWGAEIFVANVSKRHGLEVVAARLGISREEIMAIGDHFNDVEMLEWAGLGVAMGNALPEIRALADWITHPLEEDGVAHAIETFVLC